MATRFLAISCFIACVCSGCAPEVSGVGEDPGEATVLAAISGRGYLDSNAFRQANRAQFPSAIQDSPMIMSYVTTLSYPWYEKIASDESGSGVTLSEGAIIVREVYAQGTLDHLTLMVKGPPSTNPTVGDYWFGVTDPSGNPLTVDGERQMGHLTACYGCHQGRTSDGYLFGVPSSDRML